MSDMHLSERIRLALALTGQVSLKLDRPEAIALIRIIEREEKIENMISEIDTSRMASIDRLDRIEAQSLRMMIDLWCIACSTVAMCLMFGGLI